jgi:[ribosomal protein S5]-alanine N-acetyltransferase
MRLETTRLVLRSATYSDANSLLKLFSDERVLRYLPPLKQPLTLERMKKAVERRIELESKFGYAPLIVERREDEHFIGNAGLQSIEGTTEVEIAYHLLPSEWAKGYATEAAIAILEHGFKNAGLEQIIGICFRENLASARVLEKAGMKFAGLESYFGIEGLKKYVAKRETWARAELKR